MDTSSDGQPFRGGSMHSMEQSDMVFVTLLFASLESTCVSIDPYMLVVSSPLVTNRNLRVKLFTFV